MEILEGANQYKCESCNRHVDALKVCFKASPWITISYLLCFIISIRVVISVNISSSSIMINVIIIIHHTHYEKSDWSRAFNQFTNSWTWHDKCNICCRYCIYMYHVKYNICLVTKPLGVFTSETKWLNASLLFLRMKYVKNVIIKQLLNSVFAWYHDELSKPRVTVYVDNYYV